MQLQDFYLVITLISYTTDFIISSSSTPHNSDICVKSGTESF